MEYWDEREPLLKTKRPRLTQVVGRLGRTASPENCSIAIYQVEVRA